MENILFMVLGLIVRTLSFLVGCVAVDMTYRTLLNKRYLALSLCFLLVGGVNGFFYALWSASVDDAFLQQNIETLMSYVGTPFFVGEGFPILMSFTWGWGNALGPVVSEKE